MIRAEVKPELVRWARERAGLDLDALIKRFPRLEAWERGEAQPTLKQLENFARATHAPLGFLFLERPPPEEVPIPDFRTIRSVRVNNPSPDLLEMIYVCEQRQEWYQDFARAIGEETLDFVGSASLRSEVTSAAEEMRSRLSFDVAERRQMRTWDEALRRFIGNADDAGILVMCSGVVLNNNHRKLNPEEFRGFALSDPVAPLVFVNGSDSKSAQMFTLAHELAHIWLGQSAVTDAQLANEPGEPATHVSPEAREVEDWCNRVAAELLVPGADIESQFQESEPLQNEVQRLARTFKVSTLVILRRIHDIGGLTGSEMWEAYERELQRIRELPSSSGGNFYLTQAVRASKRFARALVISTLEGQTLHRDALRMLGVSKIATFHELGRSLGIDPSHLPAASEG